MNISFYLKEEIHVEEKREVYKKDAERFFFPTVCADRKRDSHLLLEESRFRLNFRKKFYYEGGETLDWVAQRSCRMVSGI